MINYKKERELMGFLDEILKIVVVDKVLSVIEKIEIKNEEKIKREFDKKSGIEVLVIRRKQITWKEKFDVYDEYQNIKYTVKGDLISIKPNLIILDDKGRKIASVKEKIISWRLPFSFESKPVDFILEIDGKKIGKVKSKWAFAKQKYEVDLNGWQIEGNILGWKYKICNKNEQIAKISQRVFDFGDTYVINFANPNNELLVLMLVLAMAVNTPYNYINKLNIKE